MRPGVRRVVVVAFAASLLGAANAAALPSDLDRSFGSHGKVLFRHPWLTGGHGGIAALVALPDGAVVGAMNRIGYHEPSSALFKVTANGGLDTSFGARGFAAFSDAVSPKLAMIFEVLLQPDGRLVVVGGDPFPNGYPLPGAASFVLARFLPNGTLDESFGNGGVLKEDEAYAPVDVALAPDGGILVAKRACTSSECTEHLIKLNADGTANRAFGTNGAVRLPFELASLAVYPDGRIAALGNVKDEYALIRFLPNGARDATFGSHGVAASQVSGLASGGNRSLVIDRHGRLVVLAGRLTGKLFVKPFKFVSSLVRYRADGRLDRSFGVRGAARIGRVFAGGVTADRNGRFVVAGSADEGVGFGYGSGSFAVARIRADGRLDRTFGQRGVLVTDLDPDPDPTASERFRDDQSDHVGESFAVGSRGITVGGVVGLEFPTYTPVLLRYRGGSGGSHKPRYTIRVSRAGAARATGRLRVGDRITATLSDRLHRRARYELCWSPHPVGRPWCTRGHAVGGPGVTGKLSRAGSSRLRFRIQGTGQVLVRRVRVHRT